MGTSQKKKAFPLPRKQLQNPSGIPSPHSSPPSSSAFPSSSNPFESLSAEEPSSPPPSPRAASPRSIPPPSPPPTIERILTRNKSKEANQSTDPPKKVGRKSNKELRDETAAKEMAMGAQQPMDSYLGKLKGSGEKVKEKSGSHQTNSK